MFEIQEVFSPARHFPTYGSLVDIIVRNAVIIAALISFVGLIFGGFSVIVGAGGGDTKKLEEGKKTITGSVAGLILVVTAVWIVQLIGRISGVPLLGN